MPVLSLSTVVQSSIAFTVLAVLIVLAFFIVSSYRDYVAGDQETGSDHQSILREMLVKGDITEEEFRTIQARTQQPRPGTLTNQSAADGSTDTADQTPPNSATDKIELT